MHRYDLILIRITIRDLKAENASVKENNLLLASHANCLQVLPGADNRT